MFSWYLSLLSIPISRLSFIWTCEIWGDQVKCSSKRTPRYFTEVVGNNLFPSSLILKELFNFVFCPLTFILLWIKVSMGQLLLFFLCNFYSLFSYVGGIPVTNLFSLLLIDRYTLAIQQIIRHEEHWWYSFWFVAIFWTASEVMTMVGTMVITTEKG